MALLRETVFAIFSAECSIILRNCIRGIKYFFFILNINCTSLKTCVFKVRFSFLIPDKMMPPRKLNPFEVKRLRVLRQRYKTCIAFMRELIFYTAYMIALCIVCYAVQDTNSFNVSRNIKSLCTKPDHKHGLHFKRVTSILRSHHDQGPFCACQALSLIFHTWLLSCFIHAKFNIMNIS